MSNTTSEVHPRAAFKYKIDTTKINFAGELTAFSQDDKIFLFFNEAPVLYSNLHIVSHEGKTDFSIFFGNITVGGQIFKINIVIILSFGEVIRFLDFLKTITPGKNEEINQGQDDEVERTEYLIQPLVDFNTIYFSPNSYFVLDTQETKQIYFGRKIGKLEEKEGSLMFYQIVLSKLSILSLIGALEKNISIFEKTHDIKLADFAIKEKDD